MDIPPKDPGVFMYVWVRSKKDQSEIIAMLRRTIEENRMPRNPGKLRSRERF
jgi:hypothetical protein